MTNIGSITKIEIIDAGLVTISGPETNKNITLSGGSNFETLVFQQGSASFKETEKHVDEGSVYISTLKFTIPKSTPETDTILLKYKGLPVVIRFTDGNGKKYVLGSNLIPAYLTNARSIPAEAPGLNAYFLEVNYRNPHSIPFTA